jgi:hypothetical protein
LIHATVPIIGDIARQHPGTHRHAITGDRHGNDHLRLIIPAFLAVAAPSQGRKLPPTPFLRDRIRRVDLEIGRGGATEDQIDVEPEHINGLQKYRRLAGPIPS